MSGAKLVRGDLRKAIRLKRESNNGLCGIARTVVAELGCPCHFVLVGQRWSISFKISSAHLTASEIALTVAGTRLNCSILHSFPFCHLVPRWDELYLKTVLEVNEHKMPERINATRGAISRRLHDLEHDSNHHAERQQIETARRLGWVEMLRIA
jgi:hypothetical protein